MATPFSWGNVDFWPGTKKPIAGGLKLLNVNTKFYKDDLASRLEILPGDPGGICFPGDGSLTGTGGGDMNVDYARHFTSEFINEKGLWECPSHLPNHLWDCLVLAAAAYEVVGMAHWTKVAAAPKVADERSVKSKWVDRPKRRWVS
jgi:phage terminase large subunit GpA-like protein